MKKILVINGHPNSESFNGALAEKYSLGATEGGHTAKLMHLGKLKFDPILHKGYLEIQELEPDLQQAQQDILWADHLVIIFPMWWGTVPALLKGFLDRVLLPGFAFKYHKNSPFWDKLLKGRTGRIIFTTDAPGWWNFLVNRDPTIHMMKTAVLKFTGITPVGVTQLTEIKNRKPEVLNSYLEKVYKLGLKAK